MGMSVATFIAIDSRAEPVAKALNSLTSSEAKDFPTFPWGALKKFIFQCTASAYTALRMSIKHSESYSLQHQLSSDRKYLCTLTYH